MRADIVKGYFVKRGISDSRMIVYWIGNENPAGTMRDQEGRIKTHRVEIKYKSRGADGPGD